jgi:hypothetical protein
VAPDGLSELAGWGFFVLFLIGTLALDQPGVSNPAFHYGRYARAPLPSSLIGENGAASYRAAWGVIAMLMLAFTLAARYSRR